MTTISFVFVPFTFIFNDVANIYVYLQVMLAVLILWIICKKKDPNGKCKLTQEEEVALISKWQPFPLVKPAPKTHRGYDTRVAESKIGKNITVNGINCLNLSSHDFLGFNEEKVIENSTIQSIRKYGIGSCGPRGFFGTVDVHLELEERLAKFMDLEEAVVYAYGFSTISSAIPAYAKRGDVIFVDEEVNFSIQKGLDASRSEIKYFKHNNMKDLEGLLLKQAELDLKNTKKAAKTRRFLVIEGIYMKTGKLCNLPELVLLSKKYKLRMFIDESISFGTLGKNGKGVTEHFNIPVTEVDLIMASLEMSVASVGGFCVGSSFIVEHQRLSGLGYCFSASLPPLLTSAAIKALDILENSPQIVIELQNVCCTFHQYLLNSNILMNFFTLIGDDISPIKHLVLRNDRNNFQDLGLVVSKCEHMNLAITEMAYLDAEKKKPLPSIKLAVSRLFTNDDLIRVINILEKSVS
ncbi:serine palmitoyltransferase 1 [Halyomorpha halys]|uniref:serine palmitoyltransferase 1 n=1 Tax=Halyomorpha halys TaxID=286706 RepID=UPI0034D25B3C